MAEIIAIAVDIALGALAYRIAAGVRADLHKLEEHVDDLKKTVADLIEGVI